VADGTTTDAWRSHPESRRSVGEPEAAGRAAVLPAASVHARERPAEVEGREKGAPAVRVHPSREGHVYLKTSLIFSPACLRLPSA
jgi:hypothetical protein